MKYETNVWYGWNGGECPVHPETVVEVVLYDETNSGRPMDPYRNSERSVLAKELNICWEHRAGFRHIIAFRIIKEHKEPREFWVCYGEAFDSMSEAMEYGLDEDEIIHVKEVLK